MRHAFPHIPSLCASTSNAEATRFSPLSSIGSTMRSWRPPVIGGLSGLGKKKWTGKTPLWGQGLAPHTFLRTDACWRPTGSSRSTAVYFSTTLLYQVRFVVSLQNPWFAQQPGNREIGCGHSFIDDYFSGMLALTNHEGWRHGKG